MYYGEFDPHMTRLFARSDADDAPGIAVCDEPEITPEDLRFALGAGAAVLALLVAALVLTGG